MMEYDEMIIAGMRGYFLGLRRGKVPEKDIMEDIQYFPAYFYRRETPPLEEATGWRIFYLYENFEALETFLAGLVAMANEFPEYRTYLEKQEQEIRYLWEEMMELLEEEDL